MLINWILFEGNVDFLDIDYLNTEGDMHRLASRITKLL